MSVVREGKEGVDREGKEKEKEDALIFIFRSQRRDLAIYPCMRTLLSVFQLCDLSIPRGDGKRGGRERGRGKAGGVFV
jgi:hypothetical protein